MATDNNEEFLKYVIAQLTGTSREGLDDFQDRLFNIYKEVRGVDASLKQAYISRILACVTMCIADELIWHIEDHNGTDCVHAALGTMIHQLIAGVKQQVDATVTRKGLNNPFDAPDTNRDTAREIMEEIQRMEAAEAEGNKSDS